jgi:hypothetical protein
MFVEAIYMNGNVLIDSTVDDLWIRKIQYLPRVLFEVEFQPRSVARAYVFPVD